MTLPAIAESLSEPMKDIARQYIGARNRLGVDLLEACRYISEAKQKAAYGEWEVFLKTIGLDEGRARAQIRIHEEVQRDPTLMEHVVSGFLSEAVARELLPAPAEVRQEVLSRGKPPTLRDVREAKRASTPAFEQPMLPDMPAPASPTDLPAEYAIIQRRFLAHGITLLSNMQGQHRAFVTRKEGMTGVVTFDWADVLSKLERLEEQTAPEIAPAEHNPKYSDVVAPPAAAPASTAAPINGWWNCGSELRAISAAIGAGDRLGATRAALHLAVVIIGDALLDYGGLMSEAEYESLRRLVKRERDAA